MASLGTAAAGRWSMAHVRRNQGLFIVALMVVVFGFWILGPLVLILLNSFNVAGVGQPTAYGLDNWRVAFSQPGLLQALGNTFLVYFAYTSIGFPIAVLIAWLLARTRMPFSHGLEFMFWVSFMLPGIATTIGWTLLLDPYRGFINAGLRLLPFVDQGPFNIYSVPGIIWAHLMANTISGAVMLLTPAFRNMDSTLEEAGRVSGASNIGTMLRVTLPVMTPAILVVLMLNIVRIFQSFETELILGTPIGFYIYSTKIYDFLRFYDPPRYGAATALGALTLLLILLIIPLQRWLLGRRSFTTVSGSFKPGLVHLGKWQPVAFVAVLVIVALLTVVPVATLLGGSLMNRIGFFQINPVFTTRHWEAVLGDRFFVQALRNTFLLSFSTAFISPVLFSTVAYVIVRTKWAGRSVLDGLFWFSAGVPGILSGLGYLWLFLGTPVLNWMFGTLYALVLVTIIQGKLVSTQLTKGVFMQMGADMEEAARVSGAGWWYTYFRIWIPLLMPTLILIGTFNFVLSAGNTSSIILIADRGTTTLSILALQKMSGAEGTLLEQAGIVSLFIVGLTAGVALVARRFGLQLGVRHDMGRRGRAAMTPQAAQAVPGPQR